MDPLKLIKIIGAIASAASELHAQTDGAISFDAAVKALAVTLTPQLPAKADGTPYTVDDIHAAAEAARAPWLRIAAKTADS